MVITDQAQFKQLVQEVRDQILSESQGVGEVDIVDNLDNIYSLPALKLNDSGDQVVEAPLSLLSAPAEEAAALARAAAYDANTAAKSANSAASSANSATDKTNEAISNAQSATQQAESSADKANTAAQKADEATAQVLSGESERVEAENARQAAETERQSAEEERKSAEEARKLAEQSRKEAEASRVSAEESRVTAESERVTAESSRAQAETERVQKESERESAEQTRQQNETTRQSNEDTRVQQEQTRQTNEEQRVSAESSRETEYTDLKQRADALIDDNEAAIENANTAAQNANAAIANMENTYAKKDEIPDVSEFITISVDNLVNYYRKSETYNQEQVNSLIGSITTINFKIVDSLPGTGENNLIYLVPSSKQEENNVKDEYIWVDGSWELIGSTKIDLSNYYTRDEVNSTFALKTELAWDTITGKPVWIGSSKPTYTWSEINEKPTTLAGYGITDAYIQNGTIVLGSNNITPLTSSNYTSTLDTRYVKKSGDTMTGNLNIMLLSLEKNNEINSSDAVYLGYRNTPQGVNVCFNNAPFTYGSSKYTVWHAGNDGSGSGLDADLLDGLDWNNFFSRKFYTINLSSYSTSNFYPLFFPGNDIELDCEIHSDNTGVSDKYNQNRMHFQLTTFGWSDTGLTFRILSRNNHTNSEITIGSIGRGTQTGGAAIWVRGGRTYRIYANREPMFKSSNYTYGTEVYSVGTNLYGGTNTNVDIIWKNDSTRNNNVLATVNGNVASATKLQTPRTIWGQSFDGTENVSGDMTNVGTINSTGTIKTTSSIEGVNIFAKNGGYFNCESGWFQNNKSGTGLYNSANDARWYSSSNYGWITDKIITPISTNTHTLGHSSLRWSNVYSVLGNFSGAVTLGSTLTVNGDLTVKGTIIDSTSSDIRLKNILEQVDYQEKLLSLGDVVDFDYNDTAFSREDSSNLEHRSYTGLIYQNVKEILPQMAHEDDDGYGYLNYLSHDYINLIAGALQQTITKQKQLEKRISILEEENTDLKQQLSN